MTPKKCITIALLEDAHGNVTVCTDLPQPAMGAPLSQAQALGLDLITQCRHRRHEVVHNPRHIPALAFAFDLIDPDVYGWRTPLDAYRQAIAVLGHNVDNANLPTPTGAAA